MTITGMTIAELFIGLKPSAHLTRVKKALELDEIDVDMLQTLSVDDLAVCFNQFGVKTIRLIQEQMREIGIGLAGTPVPNQERCKEVYGSAGDIPLKVMLLHAALQARKDWVAGNRTRDWRFYIGMLVAYSPTTTLGDLQKWYRQELIDLITLCMFGHKHAASDIAAHLTPDAWSVIEPLEYWGETEIVDHPALIAV